MQKLLSAGNVVMEPRKKASPSVTDVIVTEGPACVSPIRKRSFAERCIGVWSMVLTITNMSSTPIPKSMKGSTVCIREIN